MTCLVGAADHREERRACRHAFDIARTFADVTADGATRFQSTALNPWIKGLGIDNTLYSWRILLQDADARHADAKRSRRSGARSGRRATIDGESLPVTMSVYIARVPHPAPRAVELAA